MFNESALEFYRTFSDRAAQASSGNFILLDSKSLPRSGLHSLKHKLKHLLADDFSFCEWYQEPGCCKRMPCAVTAYANESLKHGRCKLRLTKSHDFELQDPAFAPSQHLRRLILIRDPLFILTSWFSLDQLHQHKHALEESGIQMEKIWLGHEPEVLAAAYDIVERIFAPPSPDALTRWLAEKEWYVTGFVNKWLLPLKERPDTYTRVVDYDEIDDYIAEICHELQPSSALGRNALDSTASAAHRFSKRKNPFAAPAPRISTFLSSNASVFEAAARRIIEADQSTFMAKYALS